MNDKDKNIQCSQSIEHVRYVSVGTAKGGRHDRSSAFIDLSLVAPSTWRHCSSVSRNFASSHYHAHTQYSKMVRQVRSFSVSTFCGMQHDRSSSLHDSSVVVPSFGSRGANVSCSPTSCHYHAHLGETWPSCSSLRVCTSTHAHANQTNAQNFNSKV